MKQFISVKACFRNQRQTLGECWFFKTICFELGGYTIKKMLEHKMWDMWNNLKHHKAILDKW